MKVANMREWMARIPLLVLVGIVVACGSVPLAGDRVTTAAMPARNLAAAVVSPQAGTARAQLQGGADLSINDVIVSQAVNNEPLIFNKDTVVRAVVSANAALDATVTVEFDGKTFTANTSVQNSPTTVDVTVGAPQNFQTQMINVRVDPVGGATDSDPSNNAKSVTLPMVKPNEHLIAFFLPVDWTPEQRQRFNFDRDFPAFVQGNLTFLSGAYPLGKDQLSADFTLTPHMLTAAEKHLANSRGDSDMLASHLLYASIGLAARRTRPDATLVVGVMPPGWFALHGSPGVLGFSLGDVKGTVTAQYTLADPTTSAHELGHLYWLYEDYDYSINPPRPFTWLDRSGYFVQKQLAQDIAPNKQIPTFLSAYAPDKPSWVDTRAYEYLTAKFTVGVGGQVTEPLILAATIARQIEGDGKQDPSDYAADFQRFEPKSTVYVCVAAAAMKGGETLEARWFKGNTQVLTDKKTLQPGDGWYAFALRNKNGMPQDNYHVDIYLNGALVKTSKFEVRSSQ